MRRPRSPRASTLLLGTSFAAGVIASLAGATAPGCAAQETAPTPDAAPAPCKRGPFVFPSICAPAPPDAPACSTDEGTSPLLERLDRGTRYPVDCVVNFVGERDPQGDCNLEAVCKCLVAEEPGTPPAPPDAGASDGGRDAGDAGPVTPPPPPPGPAPTTARARWSCSPS